VDNRAGKDATTNHVGSCKGKQWLATTRLRGQQLAMVEKGGGGRRRDICKRVLLDVLGFVKITLREQTQQTTNSWRQWWKLLWRGCAARAERMGERFVPPFGAANWMIKQERERK
jgi:hypothetical protein